jgi:serine protease Do
MLQDPLANARKSKRLTVRRSVLLASVAGLGVAVLFAGPPAYRALPSFGAPAYAAETPQPMPGFANLVAKVKPAVISVRVKIDEQSATPSQFRSDDQSSPFEQFFRQFGNPNMQQFNLPNAPRQHRMITGEGSGFFISADGYAVTNHHVVDHAKTVQVTTDDGKTYMAKVIGVDTKTDIALIKVDGRNDFPFVSFADQAPRIGDWVVAVGNPFGLGGTVTAGIVSARGRDIGAGPYDDFIQIDAPINKGNSGGPAFDVNGKVVGVNTAIYSPSGGSVGIGFDIPAGTVKSVVAQLKDHGYVTRGWIGVQIQPVTAALADSLGMKDVHGAIVDEPQPDSPAAKAGIASGDVITALDGTAVKDSRDLARRISAMAPGTSVRLAVLRNGEQKTLALTLGTMPDTHVAKADTQTVNPGDVGRLGLTLAPAADVRGAGTTGLVVTAVDPDGTAAGQGVRSGDVILDVGGHAVSSIGDMRKAMQQAKSDGKKAVLMRVKSRNATRFVALPLARA